MQDTLGILRREEDTMVAGYFCQDDNLPWEYKCPCVIDREVISKEVDYLNHVSHVSYFSWVGMVVWAHNNLLGLDWEAHKAQSCVMVIASQNANYLKPCFLGDKLKVATWIVRFKSALRVERAVQVLRVKDKKIVFQCRFEMVCVDLNTGKAKKIPKDFHRGFSSAVVL